MMLAASNFIPGHLSLLSPPSGKPPCKSPIALAPQTSALNVYLIPESKSLSFRMSSPGLASFCPSCLAPSSPDRAWQVLGAQTAGARIMARGMVRPLLFGTSPCPDT